MDADSVIAKGTQYVETVSDGEIVLMQVESGRFFTLSGTGRRIWELIGEPIKIGAISDQLAREFPVEREACLRDVLAFCGQLEAGGLIDVSR